MNQEVSNESSLGCLVFILIIIASFLLTIFCPQEEKPVTKKYIKIFNDDGTLFMAMNGYNVETRIDSTWSYTSPPAHRNNKVIQKHKTNSLKIHHHTTNYRSGYETLTFIMTIDGTRTNTEKSTIVYDENMPPDYDSLNDPNFSTNSIYDLKQYVKKDNVIYITTKSGKILYVFSGDKIYVEKQGIFSDLKSCKIYIDDHIIYIFKLGYNTLNINSLQ